MIIRTRFERKLEELQADILKMGILVEAELKLALKALKALDVDMANQVNIADTEVNALRFSIEEKCSSLIVTQQPTARDLRAIIAAMNMIIDLERMGDQAKGIAKVIPRVAENIDWPQPAELKEMGDLVVTMLRQSMTAYQHDDADLARLVADKDDEVDELYSHIFTQIMVQMAKTGQTDKIQANYEMLRVARELERFGDLATNIAERVIYRITGQLKEMNVDQDSSEI